MSRVNRFEDLDIWKLSRQFSTEIYSRFKHVNDNVFEDQIKRASISVMNNIAEGFERGSDAEFKRFLYYSKASCGEVRSMLYLAYDLRIIENDSFDKLLSQSIQITKMITGLIVYLKGNTKKYN